MRHRDVFQINRTNPLTARLDYILTAVSNLQVALGVDYRDIAGREPTILQHISALALEVARYHPRTTNQQIAIRGAVPGQFVTVVVDNLHINAVDDAALFFEFGLFISLRQFLVMAEQGTGGAEGRHFGHAPGMNDFDAVLATQSFHHRRRTRRATDHRALET